MRPPSKMFCIVASLASSALGAQDSALRLVRGTVFDARNQPIVSAAVIAVGAVGVITDDSGRFQIELPHRNRFSFDVRRVGFMPSRMGIAPGSDTTISILMLPSSRVLPEMSVTARRAASLAGFEQRMRERQRGAGAGRFVTAAEIEKMGVSRTTQVLENEVSLLVRRTAMNRYSIFGRGMGGQVCPATIYLDGVRITAHSQSTTMVRGRAVVNLREDGAPLDEYVLPMEIAGIEVYAREVSAPVQFVPPTTTIPCAIVAIWTKHG